MMKSLTKSKTTRIAALLVLTSLLWGGAQVALAAENTMTIAVGDSIDLRGDPSLYTYSFPDAGGVNFFRYFTNLAPLIALDSNGNIIPWLAESYEISDDYKTINFHLRKGIKFADGKPLNASVLKFYFDRILTYGYNASRMDLCVYYDHSEAVDEYTFKMYFTKGWLDMPTAFTVTSMWSFPIHPEDVDPAWDIRGKLKPEKIFNGLGAYYVDTNESVPGQKVVLKRRHSWQDDLEFHKPKMDKIVLKLIKDRQVAIMALENGEIDYIHRYWNAPLDSLPALEKNPKIFIKTAPSTRMNYLATAYWKEPFNGTDGILLRKAICYALNRTEMVDAVFYGYALPATDAVILSALRSDSPKCCHKGYDYDLDKAKKLLTEAGWNDTNGDGILDKNGKSLDLDLVLLASSASLGYQKDLGLVVQSQLKKIGVDVKIRAVEQSTYDDSSKNGNFDLIMYYGKGSNGPISRELIGFKKSRSGQYMQYYSNQNKTLASIVEKALVATSIDEQNGYLCQTCDILYEEAGIVPLVYDMQYAVMNRKVKGFQMGVAPIAFYTDHPEECWIE